ncbi:MAG: hypothetical protein AAF432_00900 [Planctomycetota bacterium]
MGARHPTRVHTQVMLCLVIGAILPWIVNIGIMVWQPRVTYSQTPPPNLSQSEMREWLVNRPRVELQPWSDEDVVAERDWLRSIEDESWQQLAGDDRLVKCFPEHAIGYEGMQFHIVAIDDRRRPKIAHISRFRQGWPWRMTEGRRLSRPRIDTEMYADGVVYWIPRRTFRLPGARGFSNSALFPYHPMWPGLLANTALYAVLTWLVLYGPRYARRMHRVRRQRCIMCAYPTPRGTTCSECGTCATGIRWRPNADTA